jgi:hypothetical protein
MHHRAAHFALCVKQNQKQNIKKSKQISIFREKKESTNGRNRKKTLTKFIPKQEKKILSLGYQLSCFDRR